MQYPNCGYEKDGPCIGPRKHRDRRPSSPPHGGYIMEPAAQLALSAQKPEVKGERMAKIEKAKAPQYDLFTFCRDENNTLSVKQHGADALTKTFGSESPAVNEALFMQGYMTLTSAEIADGTKDMRGFLPAMVRDIAPRDGIERMLAVQMVATHVALIRQGGRMANADQLPQFEAHERAYNKLARIYAAQVEALRKHRNGGKQTVTVQHVNVSDGGQAIVGNVQHGGTNKDD